LVRTAQADSPFPESFPKLLHGHHGSGLVNCSMTVWAEYSKVLQARFRGGSPEIAKGVSMVDFAELTRDASRVDRLRHETACFALKLPGGVARCVALRFDERGIALAANVKEHSWFSLDCRRIGVRDRATCGGRSRTICPGASDALTFEEFDPLRTSD